MADVTRKEYDDLTGRLDLLQASHDDTKGLVDRWYVNGLKSLLAGRGLMEFGNGRGRLDNTGIVIASDTLQLGIEFWQDFNTPSTTTDYEGIYARNSGPADKLLQILMAASSTLTTQISSQISATLDNLSAIGISVQSGSNPPASIQLQSVNPGVRHSAVIVGGVEFVVASLTADPSPVYNGGLWYRSDLGKLYARINGVTTELGAGGGGGGVTVVTKSSGYTAVAGDYVLMSGGSLLTLPLASSNTNAQITLKKTDSPSMVVIATGGNIDGLTSRTVTAQYQSETYTSDGSDWWVS